MTIQSRLANLEKRTGGVHVKPFRLVVTVIGQPLNLATSTCERTGRNGRLTEIVRLSGGSSADLSEAALERFVEQFPVTNAKSR